jgi:Tle cognate immunity protein 4 C-terminal domain
MRISQFFIGKSSATACVCWYLTLSGSAFGGEFPECVGRYQLDLPGAVDVATTTPRIYDDSVTQNPDKHIRYPIQFSDGQPTMYSSFVVNGEFDIVRGVSDDWGRDFLRKRKTDVTNSREFPNGDKEFSEVLTGQPDSFAMSGRIVSEFDIYRNRQLVSYKYTSYDDSPTEIKKQAMDTLSNLRMRKAYEIPHEEGVCLPGIFVSDSGKDIGRVVGVTFRLKEHPDVTVFLLDRSAGDLSKMSSQQRNEFVWTSDAVGKVIHLHGPLRYRPTMMAGRMGTASFATVTRYDGATDYAYLVTVQGDPKASVDTPDLELLVQRTAKDAKGATPVSGDQLEDIAKAIAASIKRRPVQ